MSEATQTEEHRMSDEITDSSQTVAAGQLRAIIERIENREDAKRGVADEIKDIYAEAKGTGFQPAIIRQIVKMRKQDQATREENEALLDLYKNALGLV